MAILDQGFQNYLLNIDGFQCPPHSFQLPRQHPTKMIYYTRASRQFLQVHPRKYHLKQPSLLQIPQNNTQNYNKTPNNPSKHSPKTQNSFNSPHHHLPISFPLFCIALFKAPKQYPAISRFPHHQHCSMSQILCSFFSNEESRKCPKIV